MNRIFAALVIVLLAAPAMADDWTKKPAPIESYNKAELKEEIGRFFAENGKMQEACNDPEKGTVLNTPQCQEAYDRFRIFMMEMGETLYCPHC